jgi:signal peptidase I
VEIRRQKVYVNDRPLADPCAHFSDTPEPAEFTQSRDNLRPYRVPAGRYFVLGDNRDNCNDSRFRGTVTRARIYGVVRTLFYSPTDWTRIGRPLRGLPNPARGLDQETTAALR